MNHKTLIAVLLSTSLWSASCNAQNKMKKEDLKTELDTVSYSLGVNIGSNIKQQGVKNLNLNALMKGMEQALAGDSTWLNDQEAMSAIQDTLPKYPRPKVPKAKKREKPSSPKMARKRHHHHRFRSSIRSHQNGRWRQTLGY